MPAYPMQESKPAEMPSHPVPHRVPGGAQPRKRVRVNTSVGQGQGASEPSPDLLADLEGAEENDEAEEEVPRFLKKKSITSTTTGGRLAPVSSSAPSASRPPGTSYTICAA